MTPFIHHKIGLIFASLLIAQTAGAEGFAQIRAGEQSSTDGKSSSPYIVQFGINSNQHNWAIKLRGKRNQNRPQYDVLYRYKAQLAKPHEFSIRNTLTFNKQKHAWFSELTPIYFYHLNKEWKVGTEVEIDYFQKGDFEISEIEIEPTIKYNKRIGNNTLQLELEAPVTRLYSNHPKKKSLEVESVEAFARYNFPLTSKTSFALEALIKRDIPANETAQIVGFRLRHQF